MKESYIEDPIGYLALQLLSGGILRLVKRKFKREQIKTISFIDVSFRV
jgi:hypothetical protein